MKPRPMVGAVAALITFAGFVAFGVLRPANAAQTTTSGRPPVVKTGEASAVTDTSATLTGSVNPRRTPTTAYFEWGTSTRYGSATTARSVRAAGSPTAFSEVLTGLTPGTSYHFRLVASSAAGTTYGADSVVTTTGATASPTSTTTPSPSPTTSATSSPTSTTSTTSSPTSTTSTTSSPTSTTSTTSSPTSTTSTTSSPTSTTSTTSTATSTSSTTAGATCTNPYFTTNDPNGGVTDGGYYVHNNLWNAASYPGTKGTTQVCSFHSWNHVGTATNNGDGAVKTYPNVHKDYSGRTISSFPRLTSTFAASSPGTGIYNVAYDLWLNGVPNDEVMIWTDNQKQVPAGSRVASGVSLGGHVWDVYATSGNGYIAFVPSNGARLTSGTIDIKAMLSYLVAQGRVASGATVDQICYGVEIVDTGGSPATWRFTDFSITDS